jgi:radical SAM protein with 4Fe4S-binding SPASM domain
MVKINDNTWVSPTTYGLVFSNIDKKQQLRRVYLDNEASFSLNSNNSEDIINLIESKGINIAGLKHHIDKIEKEKRQCDELSKKNYWNLFSLYPLQYSVQTLNYCNAKCDFCYANVPNTKDRKILDLSTIYKLKDYAAVNGVKFGVSGGEPLLHPQIYEILKYRCDEVYDTLITNLTPKYDFEDLLKTKVDLIQVSIHGYKSIHDNTIGIKNAYNLIFTRMKSLLQNVNLATNTVITPSNIESINSMVEDLSNLQKKQERNLTYVRFVPVVPSGTGLEKYGIKESFLDSVRGLLISLQRKYKEINFEIPMLHSNPYEYFIKDNKWICPAGSTVAVIRIDGHVIPCNQFLDTSVCSLNTIFDKNFQEIWLNDPLFSDMRKGIASNHEMSCSECRYLLMRQYDKNF